ncbi:YheC/YheD family protein [Bacillus sp. NTK071]|uniref:YheC/YheD family endospore coat-associated protein n=1 Tax=Bacillus sp. NTK071 TaxID=2802175 RepID=UPI001A8D8048|nr:YheC/YheD family protein [Bacillus sp. NTK071]MBN8209307.1 YheC/YheD family protein [Bacillus sp. NTK071]
MNTILSLKKEKNSTGTFYVPPSRFKSWVDQVSFPNQLCFGSRRSFCTVSPHPENKEESLLSEDLWKVLGIPEECPIHLFEKGNSLHIGPLVGIFTAGFTKDSMRPIGERSMYFAKLLSSATKCGAVGFVFGAHQINWKSGTIKGLMYNKRGWYRATVPIPDVVYDRLPNRSSEAIEQVSDTMQKLQSQYFTPWFNPGFFDKWTMFEKLREDQIVKQYLPETLLNPKSSILSRMLNDYEQVYIKPANGSLGLGIQQILKPANEKYYYCRFRTEKENRLRRYTSLTRLLKTQYPNGLKGLIVQQGIDLHRINQRPMDYRVHTNKNKEGKWEVSAIAAKIAGAGSLTTHMASDGTVKTIGELASEFGINRQIETDLMEASLQLSRAIDLKLPGFIGEIGFDLGVTKEGQIYLFEANSKPGRGIFSHARLKSEEARTRSLPMEYAIFLAKSAIEKQLVTTV